MATTMTSQVRFRTVDGLRIRYADSGGSQEPTVLLTSPWPESVYAFAPMWDSLAEHARLFAVDLPGPSLPRRGVFACRRGDLNPHVPKDTSPSR